jgi:N-acetyl-alpha-D-muramate 1-phosphate uridylyltransferase
MTQPSSTTSPPRHAMILAAGLGTRMRPLTNDKPKPLVAVGGKPLINHVLDRLAAIGVETAVVNVHYFADQIEQHLKPRRVPKIVISDERDALLGTGGGITRALPLLAGGPFFLANSDTIWIDGVKPNLERLASAFDPERMDALLLLAPTISSVGYSGRGDYAMAADGQLRPRLEREIVPFVYTGVAVLRPELFASAPKADFPLTLLFNRAADVSRLYGIRLEGVWMHVGTPESIAAAEAAILASAA